MPVPLSRILISTRSPRLLVDGCNSWLERVPGFLTLALVRRVETVCDQVQENPRDLLGEDIDLTGRGVKRPLQSGVEALLLGSRAVVGEIEDGCARP
jgi:hypothetical protein